MEELWMCLRRPEEEWVGVHLRIAHFLSLRVACCMSRPCGFNMAVWKGSLLTLEINNNIGTISRYQITLISIKIKAMPPFPWSTFDIPKVKFRNPDSREKGREPINGRLIQTGGFHFQSQNYHTVTYSFIFILFLNSTFLFCFFPFFFRFLRPPLVICHPNSFLSHLDDPPPSILLIPLSNPPPPYPTL